MGFLQNLTETVHVDRLEMQSFNRQNSAAGKQSERPKICICSKKGKKGNGRSRIVPVPDDPSFKNRCEALQLTASWQPADDERRRAGFNI